MNASFARLRYCKAGIGIFGAARESHVEIDALIG
jgi:hypothetical protein